MIYPALYGGDDHSRLISVAALDGRGAVAGFSNWSSQKVDIAAPGCAIPVLTVRGDAKRLRADTRSGTSMAAPNVSFAAGLVRSETDQAGGKLKRRILAAADLDAGDLATKVVDGRRLNVVKAAAVMFDVLEKSDKSLRFGTMKFIQHSDQVRELTDDQLIGLKCKTTPMLTLKLRSILKLARFGGTDENPQFKIYYSKSGDENDKVFNSDLCDTPPGWTLRFTETGAATFDVQFKELTDFVRRM